MADTKCPKCWTMLERGAPDVDILASRLEHRPYHCLDVVCVQRDEARAKVEEATKALESAKYELRNYTKDSMGYKNSTVVDLIEEIDAALEKLRGK